jgi:pilus assembly protein CpaF
VSARHRGAVPTQSPAVDPRLVERVRSRLAGTGAAASPARVAEALRADGGVWGDATVLEVTAALSSELAGAGPLEELLRDDAVTDVLVNGPGDVWVDRGDGLVRAAVRFPSETAVRGLALRLAARAGRRLDDASPWVDGRLPGGIRLHAVLPPVTPHGTVISLRVARQRPFTLEELRAAGSVTDEVAAALAALVRARLPFLVTGGTGTGKTTLLSALLSLVDPAHRIVLVEDSAELLPAHPHVVRLEARPANVEGAGEITLRDLVRQALRMRPDRLVVGEVRGAECVDLLAALNTGHEGGCGTVHANAATDLPARMEALGAGAGLDRMAIHSQLAAGVAAVVHLARRRDGSRHVALVGVVDRAADGGVRVVPAVGAAGSGPAASAFWDRVGGPW